ncbi:MAG TPA: hypothetical protein VLH56_11155 [Dissulfurispiraceae bacterium]|nr:hypothetical protein [Dissulfurispiraceae bacterium]
MKFSKVVVGLVIAANVIFTAAVLYIFLVTGAEPVVLIAAWFAFTTGELFFLAGIEKAKRKGGKASD